jgi:Undecaprenyl-phosphate glucose phosphotransferase
MAPGTIYKKTKVIGRFSDLERFIAENDYDEIAITLSINEYGKLERLVAICEKTGIHTKFIPDYHNIIPTVPYMEDLDGLPVINIRNVPLSNTFNRLLKRACDIIGGLMMLIIFGIPMIIIAIAVKCSSEGPVLFEQVRIGLHGRPFKMYKFRSMTQQKEADEIHAWTTANDARVTKIGKIIRRTSLDELPQIFNIIVGDMSIVGPRPERPFWVEKFKEEIPRYMIKHQVRPGLTGWAQINGYRGDTSIKKRIEYDLYYIENWKLSLDIKILFITIFKGFRDPNAY